MNLVKFAPLISYVKIFKFFILIIFTTKTYAFALLCFSGSSESGNIKGYKIQNPKRRFHSGGQNSFPCPKCKKKAYKNKGSLKRHLEVECGQPPRNICHLCKKGFHQKANFQRHNATVHGSMFVTGTFGENPPSALDVRDMVVAINRNNLPNLIERPPSPTEDAAVKTLQISKLTYPSQDATLR